MVKPKPVILSPVIPSPIIPSLAVPSPVIPAPSPSQNEEAKPIASTQIDPSYPKPSGQDEPVESKELTKLLEIIDKLREYGVSEDISLPQLVVVGDQSSGKSSVLEALTGIPFPVASTLCTRFATQISFRRSVEEKITVGIIPAKDSDENRQRKLRQYSEVMSELTPEVFSKVLETASQAMGLPKPGEEYIAGGARFADDVLKIELYGPNRSHFSVVDVPGLFQSATINQTEEDAEVVETLVKRYIEDSRTIILTVASATHETANQKIFRLAKEADPKGVRTVGLLTKPDAVQNGEEGRVMDVAKNKITVLTHGWFVVRNRSTEEVMKGVSIEERMANEKRFFMKDPWRSLDRDRVGIKALDKFLRKLLFEHIRKEYPILVKEIETLMADCTRELEELGPRRVTSDEQRRILIEIATGVQSFARDTLMGFYSASSIKLHELKLRMHIQNLNDKFSQDITERGHAMFFDGDSKDPNSNIITSEVREWIKSAYHSSRGAELPGMVNPGVVQTLFKMQTVNWENLAEHHFAEVGACVENFNRTLLRQECPDDDLRSKLWTRLGPLFSSLYQRAEEELKAILRDERGGILLTYNDYYSETLEKARKDRIILSLKGFSESESVESVIKRIHLSCENEAINTIYDTLRSYYKVARKRFVDCMALQVVERHFLGPSGPVKAFSPNFIAGLSAEELQGIAGEDFAIVNKRRNLSTKLHRLQKAQEIAAAGYY